MRIGIFGGTFDPPHVGHLLAANDAVEALSLDRAVFIPAARQPLKVDALVAPPRDRLAMVTLAIAGEGRFSVDPVEIERDGLSFTIDTLRILRARWRDDPALALVLLLGEDLVASLPKWREPEALTELAEIVWLRRGDGPGVAPSIGRVIATRRVDISSTEIRERVRTGRSIRGFVTDAVAEYIGDRRLYR